MKKFSFSLESILEYKKFLEEQARLRLEIAVAARREAREKLQRDEEELFLVRNRISKPRTSVAVLMLREKYRSVLENRVERQKEQVAAAERGVFQKRRELIEFLKDKKVLEKLKEHRYRLHAYETAREEQILSDEVALTGFSRKDKEE